MGAQQSLQKNDIAEWYLVKAGSGYELYGRVATKDQGTDLKREDVLTKSKKIGIIGNKECNDKNCLRITGVDKKGNFTIKGSDKTYRLNFYDQYSGWTVGHATQWSFLDLAYVQLGANSILDRLDERDPRATSHARNQLMIHFNSNGSPSLSFGNSGFSIGGDPNSDRVSNALKGKSHANGGLNKDTLRDMVVTAGVPKNVAKRMSRDDLQRYIIANVSI